MTHILIDNRKDTTQSLVTRAMGRDTGAYKELVKRALAGDGPARESIPAIKDYLSRAPK